MEPKGRTNDYKATPSNCDVNIFIHTLQPVNHTQYGMSSNQTEAQNNSLFRASSSVSIRQKNSNSSITMINGIGIRLDSLYLHHCL